MKRIYLVGYLLVAVFALSCKSVDYSEAPPVGDSRSVAVEDQLLIDRGLEVLQLSDAERVAQRFMFNDTKKMLSVSAATRADHLTAVRDSVGNPLMYVVNFEQGGFCIVSATKKAYPILAHGEDGFFDLEKVDQSGVCIWLDEMVYGITHRDTLSEEERIFVNSAWAEYEKGFDLSQTRASGDQDAQIAQAFNSRMGYHMGQGNDPIPLNGAISSGSIPDYVISGAKSAARNAGCREEFVIIVRIDATELKAVGPLLKTEWHQWGPYNSAIPGATINTYPAGCVAIAMAQIMNYHKWPSRFNWANMVGNYVSTKTDVADFIYQIGLAVDMKYGIDGSSSNIDKAKSAFEADFGYDAVILKDFPQNEILVNKRPYYADGMTEVKYIFGIATPAGKGHAWVCDGAREMLERKIYEVECPSYSGGKYTYQIVNTYPYNPGYTVYNTHINWGWHDTATGWYAANPAQANSGKPNYQYFREYMSVRPIKTIIRPPGGIIFPPGGGGGLITPPGGGILKPLH